jgi:hypothetical protein
MFEKEVKSSLPAEKSVPLSIITLKNICLLSVLSHLMK